MMHENGMPYPGMPREARLAAPAQDLRNAPPRRRAARTSPRTQLARLIAFGGAMALGIAGTHEMMEVVSAGGTTVLEAAMTALFAVTFTWIAFSATSAIAGFLTPAARRRLGSEPRRLRGRTALVMPVYNENPVAVTAALRIMGRGLAELGHKDNFEIVILSDSTNAESWVAETAAVDQLQRALQGLMAVWYRRRWENTAKKAGNIQEFVERWGARYDHFVVLDADSLMSPATLAALAAEMEADQNLGILQTVPTLAGGRTLYQRLQQFANRVYGPIVANGLAAWQGGDGNYWGHNAIIRSRAFAECCSLPVLPGRQPFGGPILSHDFVEAALMRRAGWAVEVATDLTGSWEESPPSLIETAARDRRWAQGNLQHVGVIGAKGLAWPSRVHFAMGIMSYCASPLWLLLILFGFALSIQAHVVKPEYFPEGFQLFPTWPLLDSERMIRLFAITVGVLLVPKALGLARALVLPELRRGCGGALRLLASAAVELVLSALYAPVMMLVHSRQILEIFTGQDIGWSPQRRDHGDAEWAVAVRYHWAHVAIGVVAAGVAWLLSPTILAWLSPTLAGLIVAIPLSRASGSPEAGRLLRRFGILTTPEERAPERILRDRMTELSARPAAPGGLRALASKPYLREIHLRWASPAPRRRGAPDAAQLTAAEKIAEAETLDEALAWLDPREQLHVASQPALLEKLASLHRGHKPSPVAVGTNGAAQVHAHPQPEYHPQMALRSATA